MGKILRPTWAEVDVAAFRHNYNEIKKKLGKNVDILSVVKADAYGHGVLELGKASVELGAAILGVALIEEGILLRKKGFKVPVLVMGSIYPLENFSRVLRHNLIPAICSMMAARKFSQLARKKNKKFPVFIKIDTGMGRIGISDKNAVGFIKEIYKLPGMNIEGIFTHLASGSTDTNFTLEQIEKFKRISTQLDKAGIHIKYKSVSNSTAVLKYPNAHFNLVRPGITLYGMLPYRNADRDISLKPVLSLKTKIVYLKRVTKGTSVSYMRTWKAKRNSFIATLPIGYADGFSRLNSNRGEVLVNGRRVPVVGNVCMDMCMIDVTSLHGVQIGDEAVLIGRQGHEEITAEELAGRIGAINYEVTCCITKRVPRIYNYGK